MMKSYFDMEGDGGSAILEQVRAKQQAIAARMASVRSVLAVGSGKGGVGKSTITTLIAAAVASRGLEVAVLDADLNGPSQARLAGLSSAPLVPGEGVLAVPRSGDGYGVVSLGSVLPQGELLSFESVAEGDTHTWRAIREFAMLGDLLAAVDWGRLDLLLVDLPPGADRTLQYAEALGPETAFLLVSTPADLAREVVARSVAALETTANRLLGYVENMAGYYCAECDAVRPLFPERREAVLPVPLLGAIPFDPDLALRLDRGESLAIAGAVGLPAALDDIVDRLLELLGLAIPASVVPSLEVSS